MYKHQKGMAVGTTSDLLSTELQHLSEAYGIISFSEVIKTAWEENWLFWLDWNSDGDSFA